MLTERELKVLDQCFERGEGRSWEPPAGTSAPIIQRFVDEGFLCVVDGRCGFEAMKDAMVRWTHAGRMAMQARVAALVNSDT